MKKTLWPILFLLLMACSQNNKINYPETRKVDTVDNYFGTMVPDPYRWLENDNSAETKAWVKAEDSVTENYMSKIPFRNKIKERLTKVWNYEKMSAPFEQGGKYFFRKNNGLQNQDVFYVKNNLNEEPRMLLDPNELSDDGTVAVSSFSVSKDGNYLAYGLSTGGSDWVELHVKNINTGDDLPDLIKWVKFSNVSWFKDGFYYSRYAAPKEEDALSGVNEYQMVYFHKLGTPQEEDKLIYRNTNDPKKMYAAAVTEDENYLLLIESDWTSRGNELYVRDLNKNNGALVKLTENLDYSYTPVTAVDDGLFVITNKNAPNKKLLRYDLKNPGTGNFTVVIPEKKDVLDDCSVADKRLVVTYMKDVHSVVEIYSLKGELSHTVELPDIGTVYNFNGSKDSPVAFYSFTSYTFPQAIYKYDMKDNSSEVYFKPDVDFDPSQYETELVFYSSKDSTKVPMYIVHKKGIKLDGTNPALLYGYGGFNVTYMPDFRVSRLVWLENGGIYANAHIRGGGEYGEEWHQAGTKLHKQNVFDDFIAAAEYLIDNKYTSSKKLAIQGGSNGGLLLGAVVNQRPDLFAVALPAVGVMDMLRFHKFTIGGAWVSDYGSSDDSVQFAYIYKYSPLHNISADKNYPAILVTTADHDDRVVPAHSFKYIATLQEKYKGPNPVLIRIETDAGHSAGKPTSKQIEEVTDLMAFTFYNLGITPDY